jgi:hypothetical protein
VAEYMPLLYHKDVITQMDMFCVRVQRRYQKLNYIVDYLPLYCDEVCIIVYSEDVVCLNNLPPGLKHISITKYSSGGLVVSTVYSINNMPHYLAMISLNNPVKYRYLCTGTGAGAGVSTKTRRLQINVYSECESISPNWLNYIPWSTNAILFENLYCVLCANNYCTKYMPRLMAHILLGSSNEYVQEDELWTRKKLRHRRTDKDIIVDGIFILTNWDYIPNSIEQLTIEYYSEFSTQQYVIACIDERMNAIDISKLAICINANVPYLIKRIVLQNNNGSCKYKNIKLCDNYGKYQLIIGYRRCGQVTLHRYKCDISKDEEKLIQCGMELYSDILQNNKYIADSI